MYKRKQQYSNYEKNV